MAVTARGDDAIRPAFPSGPEGLAPFGWDTYRLHQDLIGLRRRNAWLHRSRTKILHLTNTRMTFEAFGENQSLIVALNVDDVATAQLAPFAHGVVAGNGRLSRDGTADTSVFLQAHGWAILSATKTKA